MTVRSAHAGAPPGAAIRGETAFARLCTAALWALLAAGVFFQFYRLGAQNLWLDEIWIAVASDPTLPLGEWMREWVLADVHPPLYMFLLRYWQLVFGGDEFGLRLFSAVAGVATVVAVAVLHRWEPVVRQPLALAAWLACSMAMVRYAQEARSYEFLLLLTTVATLVAVAIAQRMARGAAILGPVLGLAATVVIAGYSHYFGVLMGGGLFGALFLLAALRHRRQLVTITAAGLGALALMLPWIAYHAANLSDKLGGSFWINNKWWLGFPEVADLSAGRPAAGLFAVALVAAIVAWRPGAARRPVFVVPLLAMALVVAAGVAITQHTPVVTGRNMMILIPPFFILVIGAIGRLGEGRAIGARLAAAGLPVLLVATSLEASVSRMTTEQRAHWRETGEMVAMLPGCDEATLWVHFWPGEIYGYYVPNGDAYDFRTVTLDEKGAPLVEPPVNECPLLLWSGQIPGFVDQVREHLGLEPGDLAVWQTSGHMLILDRERLPAYLRHLPAR